MAQQNSFDIVSQVDLQEVDNALNQARKEIGQRYDFKDSKTSIELNQKDKKVTILSDDDFRMKSVIDIVQSKLVKRGISLKALKYGTIEPAAGGTVRQIISLQVGIDKENAKAVVKLIKDSKIRVQAQIMEDQVRVSGKDKDDLQTVMKLLRESDFSFAMQFVNYR
ncbi:MAG: YajQ family cyclic di-GMP-binding protein [Ignavibacteriales bacterium]|nr:YajQ family cyclic di-GMP-binding protein [Ignavibacteriales bacterium]MBI3787585.1 YajQ family cyclic di-GMP-binding protein [Ignavibacteriales bacterium]